MIINPNGYEIVREKKNGSVGTVEKAMSLGIEDAIKDKGRECDYEFNIKEKKGMRFILCEVKVDNGYFISYQHPAGERQNLSEIERDAYKFLLERL